MKTFWSFISACVLSACLSVSAFAQTENPIVKLDSIYTPGDSKTIYTYNNLNQISECLYIFWDEEKSRWEEYDRNERTYDENGRLMELKCYENIDGEWLFARTVKLSYDEEGKLVRDSIYSRRGEVCGFEEYTYNDKGQMAQSIYYDIYKDLNEQEVHRADSRLDFKYDEFGNIIQEIEYDLEEDEPEISCAYSYTYDNETLTVEGTKKIIKCIYTQYGRETESFYYYSAVSTTGMVNMPSDSSLQEVVYSLSGTRVLQISKGQIAVKNNHIFIVK